MGVNIKAYQDAYENALNKFKGNSRVLAVVVYGSIISGDIWEKSDIDFLVITREHDKMDSIFTKILNVSVHANYISKDIFINSYKNMLKGGTFHKAFFTGKLVYCIDDDIKEIHLSTKFYSDRDRDIRNIEILCNLINSIHYAQKYQTTGRFETAYQWCVEVLKNYSRLLMNMHGHITDKDVLSFAVNMDKGIDNLFEILNEQSSLKDKIAKIVDLVEKFIVLNIENISKPLIQYISMQKSPCSVRDIQNSTEFAQIDADINVLTEKLSELGYIKEGYRKYKTGANEYLIEELVYFYR